MKIIDAHTHIDSVFDPWQPNVVGVVCCVTKESEWASVANLCANDNRVYGAFGIHPWFINDIDDEFGKHLESLLLSNPKYMVGEIGLDKYKPDMDKQIEIFIKQFDIAVNLKRNVFLHCVGAWDKMLHILKQYNQSFLPKIIVHGFNENDDILRKLLKYENVFFSVSKNYVYSENSCIEQIPNNRILIETDGKKDVLLKDVLNKIIDIKDNKNMSDIIYNNTLRMLNDE